MWDMLHTTATLQGIVNRKSPNIYIDYVVANKLEVDRFWWNYYREEGRWLAERDTVVYNDVVKLVEDYKGNQLLLFASQWSIQWTTERNKFLTLSEFGGASL